MLSLEGDRDRERRRDRTAAETSTWWTPFGEGSVRAPPLPFPYDMVLATVGYLEGKEVRRRLGGVRGGAGKALEEERASISVQGLRSI